jgi:glycosyltransferase involved in cell wall biosynthesis
LLAHGQTVDLITFDFSRQRYQEIMGEKFPDNVAVHSLPAKMEVKPPFTVYKRRRNINRLINGLKGTIPDYDYLFSTQYFSAFEGTLLKKGKKNIAYVHFPEIHFAYSNSGLRRKAYLLLYKRWLDKEISKLDMIFCNSSYTKLAIEKYWHKSVANSPIVVYPPVELESFWCDKPLKDRPKRVTYVGRFIGIKRHEIIKQLAVELPQFEFMSIGGLRDNERQWFNDFSKELPVNYSLKPNVEKSELAYLLSESRVYCHLMEGEHFGIAPIEALASGCVTLVHNSGGSGEFIPEAFWWSNFEELKQKIIHWIDSPRDSETWETQRQQLWQRISVLKPEVFETEIWQHVNSLMRQTASKI